MSSFEVPEPILCSAFEEPTEHWWIQEGEAPERRSGRRPAMYYFREPGRAQAEAGGYHIELKRVNRIRESLKAWREQGWPGVTRTTRDLLEHWRNPERERRLFFAQVEAAETIIFLTEARADFLQGIEIPRDEPSDEQKADGYAGFLRYACKMATGSGKTTVMGLLAAWSILNKVQNRADARFSDVVLIVCPNVTIRDRLRELDPTTGEASLYVTRDLVPPSLRKRLLQGRVLVTNWHAFAPQTPQTAGDGGRVVRVGVAQLKTEKIRIGEKNDTKRGQRWLTRETLLQQKANGLNRDPEGRSGVRYDAGSALDPLRGKRHRAGEPAAAGRAGKEEPARLQRRGPPRLPGEGGAPGGMGKSRRRRAGVVALGQDGGHGLGGRARPHPQAAGDQCLRRPVGDAVFPEPGRAGGESSVSLGRE